MPDDIKDKTAMTTPVRTPAYDRSRLTPGIVHIGLGNFHRAHMAVYLDDLLAMGEGHDWAILGAGVRDGDARMRETVDAGPTAGMRHYAAAVDLLIDLARHPAGPFAPYDRAVLQREADEVGGEGSTQTDLIILTHDAREGTMNDALAKLQALKTVLAPIVRIRKEELAG